MKNIYVRLLLLVFCLFGWKTAFPQSDYHVFDTIQEVKVDYRWQRERFFSRDSNAVLNLQLTNLSEEAVEVVFVATFFRNDQALFETPDFFVCIPAGERVRGGRAGLRFMADGITMSTVARDWFDWDITYMEVVPVLGCD